jgi:pyruvate-formate lyase-activating enzyme
MGCRGCLCQKVIYDCHLKETKASLFEENRKFHVNLPGLLELSHVLDIIKSIQFDKVIFMGMEPTIDSELPYLAEAIKKNFQAYTILLTNGLRLISLEYIDEVVLSLKAFRDELHREYTGVSNKEIKKNFFKIHSMGKRLRAESVLIPDYIDCFEIEYIAKFIARIDGRIPYRIDAYFPAGKNPWRRATPEEVENAVRIARRYLINVSCIRGDEELKFEVLRLY